MAVLSELIRHDAPLWTGSSAVYPFKSLITKRYRFVSRFDEEVKLYRVDGNVIHLPRALCPVANDDRRDPGTPVHFPKTPEPRPHQETLFRETREFLQAGQSGVVSAYTGWGKTVLGYYAAAVLGVKTLVVTTKDDIYQQWIKGAETFLGLKPHEIGEIRGDKCQVVGTKFVVAMIHSLSKDGKYPDWIGDGFGLVIFDECHRVPAEQFSEVADRFAAKWRLGLSATPERADGKELLVYAHIGPVRAKTKAQLMVPKVLRFTSAWECPRVLRENKNGEKRVVRLPHQAGKTAHIEKIIAADPVRNHMIADLAESAFRKGRTNVIFSTQHEHLHSIERAIVQMGISKKEIGYYIGATTKADKDKRDKQKVRPILLTTFAMMGEGTSIDWIDTCILAMPRSNVTQPVGRIRREYPDKGDPVVMDIMDHDSPVFSGYAANRLQWYNSIGADIKDM